MELRFEKTNLLCLDTVVQGCANSEQTQELRLPDGMPDVGRILAAWGQGILRGKEWRGDSVAFTGGLMVWVLYAPEDGSGERWLDAWIPFQMKWDIPAGTPEGSIRIQCRPRFVDARPVSARKIMVRAGMSAMVEVLSPDSRGIYAPEKDIDGVQLLRSVYPIRLPKEAGEKTFLQDEDLTLPDSAPQPEKLVYWRAEPMTADKKVLSEKVVFRGATNLHVLYRSGDGGLYSWDFSVPFSQYADLGGSYGSDAQADILLCPTSVELELDDGGHLRFKCGVAAQYVITDKQPITLIEDAYSPGRELTLQTEILELPALLENRRETLYGDQTLQAPAERAADLSFQADFPRQERTPEGLDLTVPGTFQLLYYGEDGSLQSGSARWEGTQSLPADEQSRLTALPGPAEIQTSLGGGTVQMKAEIPLELTAFARQGICMVTGLELGDQRSLDPQRPSLILRRPGENRLWDLAKACGSTVEAIRRANNLTDEPAPNQMLLIPVP